MSAGSGELCESVSRSIATHPVRRVIPGVASTLAATAERMAWPVASFEWMIRRSVWPPSRVRSRWPAESRSNATAASSISISLTARGPSRTSCSMAAGFDMRSPASRMSRASGAVSALVSKMMPPWAQSLLASRGPDRESSSQESPAFAA